MRTESSGGWDGWACTRSPGSGGSSSPPLPCSSSSWACKARSLSTSRERDRCVARGLDHPRGKPRESLGMFRVNRDDDLRGDSSHHVPDLGLGHVAARVVLISPELVEPHPVSEDPFDLVVFFDGLALRVDEGRAGRGLDIDELVQRPEIELEQIVALVLVHILRRNNAVP